MFSKTMATMLGLERLDSNLKCRLVASICSSQSTVNKNKNVNVLSFKKEHKLQTHISENKVLTHHLTISLQNIITTKFYDHEIAQTSLYFHSVVATTSVISYWLQPPSVSTGGFGYTCCWEKPWPIVSLPGI